MNLSAKPLDCTSILLACYIAYICVAMTTYCPLFVLNHILVSEVTSLFVFGLAISTHN